MRIEKHPSDFYCYLCKKYHRVLDKKDKNRLVNFHQEWADEKKAKEQIRRNKEVEKEFNKKFKKESERE